MECRPPQGPALVRWLIEEFKSRGIQASPRLCEMMIRRAGDNPHLLLSEAEKLSLFLGPGQTLDEGHILALVSPGFDAQLYHLADHLGRRRLREAMFALLEILSDSHRPKDRKDKGPAGGRKGGDSGRISETLAACENRFLALVHFKTLAEATGGRAEETADLKPPDFIARLSSTTIRFIREQAPRWSWPELIRALADLEESHRTLRLTGNVPGQAVLENLVLKLGSAGRDR